MFGEIVGYCLISKDSQNIVAKTPDKFKGETLRVLEFDEADGALVVSNCATEIAMVEKEHILRFFQCEEYANVLTPTNLNLMEKMFYVQKVMTRRGGYNNIMKALVIASSLHSGKFNDNVLWAKQ